MKALSPYVLLFMMVCSWCPLHGIQTDFSQDDDKPITLITNDDVEFKISHYLMSLSETLKESKLFGDDEPIPLPGASAEVLSNVLALAVQGELTQEFSLESLLKMLGLADYLEMKNIKEPLYKEIPFHITRSMPMTPPEVHKRYGAIGRAEIFKLAYRSITWKEPSFKEFMASSISVDDKLEILKKLILEDRPTVGLIIGDERLFINDDYMMAHPTPESEELAKRYKLKKTPPLLERRRSYQKSLDEPRSKWNLKYQVDEVLIPALGKEAFAELKKQLEKKYPADPAEIKKRIVKSVGYDPWIAKA